MGRGDNAPNSAKPLSGRPVLVARAAVHRSRAEEERRARDENDANEATYCYGSQRGVLFTVALGERAASMG